MTRGRDGVVLVFGESRNDSESIRYLLASVNRRLDVARVRALPRPTSLQRTAGPRAVRSWVDEIRRVTQGVKATGQAIAAVVVHRDADCLDADGVTHSELTTQLGGLQNAHPVVPVEELEAWWFLFPDALEAVRPRAWRGCVPRRPRDVETIRNPKQELMRLTGRRNRNAYAESDSVSVARHVFEKSLRPMGKAASYARFEAAARSIAASTPPPS